jgi:hypothetical protein
MDNYQLAINNYSFCKDRAIAAFMAKRELLHRSHRKAIALVTLVDRCHKQHNIDKI